MKALAAFFCLSALAASAPLWPRARENAPPSSVASDEAWPVELVSPGWQSVALGERERRFARDFPGRLAVFATADDRTILLRLVHQPTRKLHPAADCLRAVGYTIEPRPIHRQIDGVEWAELRATRGNDVLRVRERILGADGRRWTDISAWYWSAALGRATGPWWAVTEFAPD
jgi:hypothetical protein